MQCRLSPSAGHTAPAAQEDRGAWPPASSPRPWGFLLSATQRLGSALSGSETVSAPFSETPKQRGCPCRKGKGAQRGRVLTNTASFSSFRAEDGPPSRPPPETRGPGPQQSQGQVCAPGPPWPACGSYDVALCPPGRAQPILLEEPHPAARRLPASR